MIWIIVSLVLGLVALIGYSIYCQWRNSINIAVVVEHHAGLVTDMLNEHHIVTAAALQELQDVTGIIRKTTDATHLRHIDRDLGRGLYAPSTKGNDQSIFDVVDALVKDLETSKAQVPAVDPAAWGGPQQAVPEDPWKNAR